MKTLVLYTFHEYNERVTYFIQNALFQRDDVLDVYINIIKMWTLLILKTIFALINYIY